MTQQSELENDEDGVEKPYMNLVINGYGVYDENDIKQIKALTAKVDREARIDELDFCRNACAGGQNCEYQSVLDRLNSLQKESR